MLAYYSSGSGLPVVFLHGFCENKAIWTDFIKLLPNHYQYIVPDMPGFGESLNNLHYQSIEEMAEEVYIFLETLKIEKAVFICHSLGGYVALALAEMHPELFAGLCMFHSVAFADSEERKNIRNKTADFINNKGIKAFLENFVPGLFYKERRQELESELKKVKEITSITKSEVAATVTLAMRDRLDRTHVLQNASFPVMFIAGKDDELMPVEAIKSQFFLPPNSIIHLLAKTGHMGMYESPKETSLMIVGFLKYTDELK
jgi:pimeloyl-ACP methyl ester carboxylesterase